MLRQKRLLITCAFLIFAGCSQSAEPMESLDMVSEIHTSHQASSLAASSAQVSSAIESITISSPAQSKQKTAASSKPVKSTAAVSGGLTPAEVEKLRAEAADIQRQMEELDTAYSFQVLRIRNEIARLENAKSNGYLAKLPVSEAQQRMKQIDEEIQAAQDSIATLTAEFNAKMVELQKRLGEINEILKAYPAQSVAVSNNASSAAVKSLEEQLAEKYLELQRVKAEYAKNKKSIENEITNFQRSMDSLKRAGNTSMAAVFENTLAEKQKELERVIAAYESMIRELEIEIAVLETKIRNSVPPS